MSKKIILSGAAVLLAVAMLIPVASAQTVAELQAQIQALLLQINQMQALIGQKAAPSYTFTRDLTVGARGTDVSALQGILISGGYLNISAPTGFFGPMTRAALARYQAAKGITPSVGYFGARTRAHLALLAVRTPAAPIDPAAPAAPAAPEAPVTPVTPTVPVALGLSVKFDGPAAGTIIAGQAIAELSRFVFQNDDEAERKVTNLVFTRTGISADSILRNVYLYDGVRRLTDAAVVSAGKFSFNNPAGLFTIPTKSSRTISVRADILTGTSGQTVGIALQGLTDIVSDASGVSGVFPLSGNAMTVATADLATVLVPATGISAGSVDAGTRDYIVWRSNLSIGTRDVNLRSLQLRQIGSVRPDDLQNFKLFVRGIERGTAVSRLAADNTVTFDLSASPVRLTAGSALVEVRADVIGGSNRNFSFSLKRASDLDVQDAEFKVNVLATGAFPANAPTTGEIAIPAGTMTVSLAAGSPSGDIVFGGTDVTLARYTLTAFGESVRVENLRVDLGGSTFSQALADVTLRNGRLLANNIQVGSTAGIIADTGTTYELGSALIVRPGSPVELEIRADIFDSEGTNGVATGNTIRARLVAGLSNAQRMESLGFFNAPGVSISGNVLRATIGALTLERNMAYGHQTLVAGTDIRIGSFNLRSAAAETINISSYVVSVSVTGAVTLANLSNLRISESTTVRSAVASGDNAFPVSQAFAANITRTIDVFADVSTAVTSGTIIPSLRITATGASTGEDVSVVSAVAGQTITISPSSLVVTLAPATAESGIVVGGTRDVAFATYRFTATNEAFTITDATITVTNPASLLSLTLGGRTVPVVGTSAVFSGLSISVPRDVPADVAVTANWNTVAAGAGTSGTTSTPTLSAFRAEGVQSRVPLDVSATSPTDGTLTRSNPTLLGGVTGATAATAVGNITVITASTAAGNITFTIGPVSYTTAAITAGITPAVIAERIRDSIAGHVSPNAIVTSIVGSAVHITSTVSGAAGNTPITIASPQIGATFTSAGLTGGVTGVTAAHATGTVTVAGTWRVGDRATVTIGGTSFTHTVVSGATSVTDVASGLVAAITHASVTDSSVGGVITIRAITPGIDGNTITLATSQSGPGADVPGRTMTLRKTVPTVTSAAADAALTAGERNVMRITVAANPAEDVELRTLTFRITTGAATTLASGSVIQVRRDGVIIAASTAASQLASTSADRTVSLIAHADRFVPKGTSRTFEVIVTGITLGTGATTLEAQLLGGTHFLWRDGSLPGIDISGDQVRTLPSAGFTLTRS